ncbi:uncharacterized protein BJ171DRAFT_523026 [Polychytrium aggregatum]|uniref:uncharacterized protein n=1 Tax=Polychytrium aggregatum TaxID=110093 RepID=UPI0022FDC097|nr:uncharacterized protein BJ171DRAFT_523026 [Polychytrium aggregatum]KAI9197068.1 hypothetical protein BJ171DRAFT_523026 [Polychytrium aggregatum]
MRPSLPSSGCVANGDVRPHKSELTTVPEAQSSRDIAPQPNAHSGPVKSQTTASMPAGGQSKSAVPSKPLQRPPVSLQKLPSSVPDDSGKGSVAWSIPVRSSGSQAVRAAPRRPPGKVEMVTVSTETDEIEDLIPVTVPAAAVVDPNASGPGSPVPAEGSAECAPPANNGNNSNNEASVDSASPPDDSAGDSSTACESSASDSDSQSSVDSTQSLRRSKATYLRPADSLDIGEGWDPSTFVERPRHPPSIMYPSKRSRLRAISPPCIRWRKYEKSIEGAVGRLSVASRKKQEHPPKTTDPEPGPEPVPEKPPTEEDLKESLKAKILQDIEEKARIWLIESIEERTRQWVEEQKSKLDAVLKDGEQVPWSSPEVARKAAASLQDAGGLRPAPRSMGDKATEESPEARRRRPRETAAPSVAEPIKSIMKSTQKEHASGKRSHKHSNSHSSAPKGSEPSFPTKPRVRIVTGLTKSRSQESLSKLPPIDPRYASVMAAAGYPYLQGYPDPRLAGYRSDRPGYYPAAPEHWGGYPPEMVAAASLPRLFPLRRSSSMASAPVLPGTLGVPMPFFPPPLASDGYSKSRPIKSLSFPGASSGGFGSRPHKSGAVPGWGAHGPGRQGGLQPLPSQSYDRGYQFSRMQGPSGLAKSTPRLARSSSHRHPKGSARGRPEARISIGSYSRPRSNGSRSRSRSKSQAHGRLGQRSQSMSRSRSKSRPRSRSQSGLVPLGRSWSLNSQQPSKESRTLGALQQPPFRLANSWTYDVGR